MIANNIVNSTVGNMLNVAMNGAAPETAGFDFMNYLLGLQTSPLDFGNTDGNGPADVKSQTSPNGALLKGALVKTDTEAGKSSKQELEPWNLIFPGMVPAASPVDLKNIANQNENGMAGDRPVVSVDPMLAQAGLLNQATPDQSAVPAGMVRVDANHPELRGARLLHAETFGLPPAVPNTDGKFVATSARLQSQAMLTDGANAPASQHAVVQRYAQVARGESESMTAMRPTGAEAPSEIVSDNGERKQVSQNATAPDQIDPTVVGLPHTGNAHAAKASGGVDVVTPAVPQTVPQMHARVQSMAQAGGGKMTVALTPPELGKVEVQVTTRGKRVEIKMTSDSTLAKSVLESGLGELRRQLEGQNLQLARTEVQVSHEHFSSGNQHQTSSQFFGQQQGGSHSPREERGSQAGNAFFHRAEPKSIERVDAVAARRVAVAPGRVDVRI